MKPNACRLLINNIWLPMSPWLITFSLIQIFKKNIILVNWKTSFPPDRLYSVPTFDIKFDKSSVLLSPLPRTDSAEINARVL